MQETFLHFLLKKWDRLSQINFKYLGVIIRKLKNIVLNAKDNSGKTALHIALEFKNLNFDLLKNLLELGCKPSEDFAKYPNSLWYLVLEKKDTSELLEEVQRSES